jgi:YidC/Oxa1 family membrane protein insertase
MMNKLALYVFPLGVVVGGPFLPLAIIIYWLANNVWTFGQQHYVFGKIEKEEEEKKLEAKERRSQNAPAPGAKPKKQPKAVSAEPSEITTTDGVEVGDASTENGSSDRKQTGSSPGKTASGNGSQRPRPGASPRPGARPKKRKR